MLGRRRDTSVANQIATLRFRGFREINFALRLVI